MRHFHLKLPSYDMYRILNQNSSTSQKSLRGYVRFRFRYQDVMGTIQCSPFQFIVRLHGELNKELPYEQLPTSFKLFFLEVLPARHFPKKWRLFRRKKLFFRMGLLFGYQKDSVAFIY